MCSVILLVDSNVVGRNCGVGSKMESLAANSMLDVARGIKVKDFINNKQYLPVMYMYVQCTGKHNVH